MAEQTQDANATPEINREVGTSSIPEAPKIDPDSLGVINTVDEKAEEPKGEPAAKAEAEKADEADKAKGQEARYDKDPRWQEIMKARDEAMERAIRAEAKLDTYEKKPMLPVGKPPEPEELPYKDITKMSKEELIEWFEEDPVGFVANQQAQMLHEARQTLKAEAEQEKTTKSVQETFENYMKEHEDFNKMWESGEISKYMEEHPGHNAISAHMILTKTKESTDVESKIKAAYEKGFKEAEAKVVKNFQAKRNATVLDGGTAGGAPTEPDAELQNTKERGGLNKVIAERLARLRQRQ